MPDEACFACGHSAFTSHTKDRGTRIECDHCGISLSGWCANIEEARRSHVERSQQMRDCERLRAALESIANAHTVYRKDPKEYFREAANQFVETARAALEEKYDAS